MALKVETKTVRLADVAPAGGELTRMEDIADRDLRLFDYQVTETQYGPGYRMRLADLKTEDQFEVLTSAVVVVKQLTKMKEVDPFAEPIVCFTKAGRCWQIV